MQGTHTGYTSCGFQSNLQVHSSLARAVTVDKKVSTNSRTLHTLNVNGNKLFWKTNMTYFKYIFSDRKAFQFWIPFYVFIIIYVIVFITGHSRAELTNEELIDSIYPLFILSFSFLSFFIFYTAGYLNLKRQEKFLVEYSKQIDNDSIQKREIEIYRSNYNVNGFKTNWQATIKPKPKLESFTVFEMENKIGIFGCIYEFGLFRRELRPILIDTKNYENPVKYRFALNPKISSINWVDNDMEIVFSRSSFGIWKIKLLNWEK